MEKFVLRPNVELYPGVRVDEDTELDYSNESVSQHLECLTLHSTTHVAGEGFESVWQATIHLQAGDILIFDEKRGYIKPVEPVMTALEAAQELQIVAEMG